jgi:hypothetical protein
MITHAFTKHLRLWRYNTKYNYSIFIEFLLIYSTLKNVNFLNIVYSNQFFNGPLATTAFLPYAAKIVMHEFLV